jgi:hypothetical protein
VYATCVHGPSPFIFYGSRPPDKSRAPSSFNSSSTYVQLRRVLFTSKLNLRPVLLLLFLCYFVPADCQLATEITAKVRDHAFSGASKHGGRDYILYTRGKRNQVPLLFAHLSPNTWCVKEKENIRFIPLIVVALPFPFCNTQSDNQSFKHQTSWKLGAISKTR